MSETEAGTLNVCMACGLSGKTSFHFGGASCTACASFFRRTVSLNIRYICKREKDCISSPELRSICRACRYECCVNKAELKRELVQQRRNDKRTPKYILDSRKEGGSEEVVRDYITNSYTTLYECTESGFTENGSEDEGKESDFSKILNISHASLLKFYVTQTETAISDFKKNTLNVRSPEELIELSSVHHDLAVDWCASCPGVDLLEKEDLEVVFKYCVFTSTWLDSAWASSMEGTCFDKQIENPSVARFITQFEETIVRSFSCLELSVIEYSALKSFCIWKLGVHDSTLSFKIVAQEQYLGVTSALRSHYENTTNLEPFEIATRIAEITLQIGPIFGAYRDMMQLYENINVPFGGNTSD